MSSFWLIVGGLLAFFRSFGLSLADSFGFLNTHEGRQFYFIDELSTSIFSTGWIIVRASTSVLMAHLVLKTRLRAPVVCDVLSMGMDLPFLSFSVPDAICHE